MLDIRKSLDQLREEWVNCVNCELGRKRVEAEGQFVFGEGTTRGVMFIGEGPGKEEERTGRPFDGNSGQVLRNAITKIGLTDYYITNTVCCRSCSQEYDSEGKPVFYTNRRTGESFPKIKDMAPLPAHTAACLPRLMEQIFLVDPIVIVALGGEATKTLCGGQSIAITSARGQVRQVGIAGAGFVPVVTSKKRTWLRKLKNEFILPIAQNQIGYLVLPTLHPSFVLRRAADQSKGNAVAMFINDLKLATSVYDRYMWEAFGINPAERELTPTDLMNESLGDEQ